MTGVQTCALPILSFLAPEVEGERRKGKERERNSKKIIKNNI